MTNARPPWTRAVAALRRSAAGRFLAGRLRRPKMAPPATPGGPKRLVVPHLEIHITHECNLSCDGCLHYTNNRRPGTLSIEDVQRFLAAWSRRVRPESFAILGGEPCLHRDLTRIVYLVREQWPDPATSIQVVTNGLLLHLHPELPNALAATNTGLYISIHSTAAISPRYQEMLDRSLELAKRWQRDFGILLEFEEQEGWYRGYKGYGEGIEPFEDGNPQKSWDNCVTGQQCFQISEGRIWKCSLIAYLGLQARAFELSDKWKPYLDYRALEADCTDAALIEFFNRQAEPVCGMCPNNPEEFTKGDPLIPVTFHRTPPA